MTSFQMTQAPQRNVAIVMRANLHKLSPPQSCFHKNTHTYRAQYTDVPVLSVVSATFHAFAFIWTCLNSFSFILNRHGYSWIVFIKSTSLHAVPDAIVVNKHMNGSMSLVGCTDDCYWSLLAFRCVENRIDPIVLRIAIFWHLRRLALCCAVYFHLSLRKNLRSLA